MKKKLFFTGMLNLALAFGLALVVAGCDNGGGGGGGGSDTVVTTAAIPGVAAPKTGGTPVAAITATDEYTGTVKWTPAVAAGETFAADIEYTATITLKAESGYTFAGVKANFFKVAGATATNAAGKGVVTAEFPATVTAGKTVTIAAIQGVTAPATGGIPVTSIRKEDEYTGTVTWSPTVAAGGTFAASETYTATITLTAAPGYTFDGVKANFFTVAGATGGVTNAADSGVVKATFPATNAGLKITPKSTALVVSWPQFGNLTNPNNYYVRYKETAKVSAGKTGSNEPETTDTISSLADTFAITITKLQNDISYTVWVWKSTDSASYTTADPLYTGIGTPAAPTQVNLVDGSHGTAGANIITGLEASATYVVKEGDSWFSITTNGDIATTAVPLDTAISNTSSGVKQITRLSNNSSYNVFLVKPQVSNANTTLDSSDTNGKNTVVDVRALTTGKKLTITSSGGTLIVYTNEVNATTINKAIAQNDLIGSTAKGYKVTEATLVPKVTIKATANDKFAEIDLSTMPANGTGVIVFEVQ